MEKTYISITITHYNSLKANMKPQVHYYRNDGKTSTSTYDDMSVLEANKLMWILMKLGGKNSYVSNWFNNAISTRTVTFWGRL